MIAEVDMKITKDKKFYTDAINRIHENIRICEKTYKDTDLIQSYQELRQKYIREMASFFTLGETPNFVSIEDLPRLLKNMPCVTKVDLKAYGVEAENDTGFTPRDLAVLYAETGREFLIHNMSKVLFIVK
jgi:coproporphyrinogen III oxidase-like Fe-S oxidoreductase